jgi:6-phosphogluconolactonase
VETDSVEQTSSSATAEPASSQDAVSSSDVSTPATPKQSWVFTASTNGQLHAFELDTESGAVTERGDQEIGSGGGDVFIAMAPGSTRLFAVYNRGIVAFDFDPATAGFTERARGTTLGGGTYVGISPDEQHAYVAHYGENQLSYLTFDGSAFSSAQGFAAGQRVHSAQESASGGWVLVPCLGSNYVAQYRRDGDELQPAPAPTVAVAGGPRHFAFHPNQAIVYVLSELSSELRTFEFTGAGGLGAVLDTDQIGVEQGGKYWGSDVKVSPDGRDVFAVDRNAQLVYHFDVQDDGTLEASGVTGELGGVVRAFDRTPDGKLLVMGNENGVLVTFRFDASTNALEAVPNPADGLGTIHTTLVREL